MITNIKVSALKSIALLDMDCTKLNILTGMNSSGKSTMIQSILLFFQNIYKHQGLNGELVTLGDFRADVKNGSISADKVEISVRDTRFTEQIALLFSEDTSPTILGNAIDLDNEKLIAYEKKVHYLSCNRIGARDVYMKNYSGEQGIGKDGEYALYYLQDHKKDNLQAELCRDSTAVTLEYQVNYWLTYIMNTSISVEDVPSTDIVKGSFSVGAGRSLRPRNVGSGVSYLISIIIMCLASNKGDVLIVENPEIHLHPRAQSRVCEFLYFVSCSGRQLFVETHSDHIFNGVRAGIAQGNMNSNDIAVNFLELDDENCTKNTRIEFGKRGRILNYTEGLFDQFDIDLNKMLDI